MNQKEILKEIERRNPDLYLASFEYDAKEDIMWVHFASGRRMLPMYEKGVVRTLEDAKQQATKLENLKKSYGSTS